MRSERFPVSGPVSLTARLDSGEVRVETGDADEVTVELEPLNDAARKTVEAARIQLEGEEVLVEVGGKRFGPVRVSVVFGTAPAVRAKIRVPHGSRLRCEVTDADLHAIGRYRAAEVNTVSGDVRFDEAEGDGTFKTISGDVEVRRIGGKASLNTVSGDVAVRELGAGARAKSVSGDVDLAACEGGAIAAQSVSGDIRVGVRPGATVWVDARSISGATTSELAVGDEPPADSATTLEVRANSVSGDIQIVRSVHATV